MLSLLNFVFIVVYGFYWGMAFGQEGDVLTTILQHMQNITVQKRSCPVSLSKYDLSLPTPMLNAQFYHEINSTQRLVNFLDTFLSYGHAGTGKLEPTSRLQTAEQVARSAFKLLLESEPKIKGAHLCWNINDVKPGAGAGAPRLGNTDNLKCHYFLRSSTLESMVITTSPPTGSYTLHPTTRISVNVAHPTTESIHEQEKNAALIVRDMLQPNTSLILHGSGWTPPYLDCTATWLITYLVLVNKRKDGTSDSGNNVHYSGTFGMDIDLIKHVDINQCHGDILHDNQKNIFAFPHKCKLHTTECQNISGHGFKRGGYRCVCKPGYYSRPKTDAFYGTDIEELYAQNRELYDSRFDCYACSPDCITCTDGSPCVITQDVVARGFPLGTLAFCITCAVCVGGAVYRYRRRKVIASATWLLLENIILGAVLIYCSVIIRYFTPTFQLCMAEPWLRELGFMLFYCAVILKLYKCRNIFICTRRIISFKRVVTEFRTRKAHCVYVRDKDLVKYHVGIILITIAFMSAWTSITMDLHRDGKPILLTDDRHRHTICRLPWWDYVAESCETLILLWGIYLSYLARNSKTLYMERKLLTAAICVELLVSGIFYIIRHIIWNDVHPDTIYLLYFGRSQLTITVNLCIIFGGKLWYIFRPQDDPFRKNQAQGTQGRPAEMEKLHDGIFAGDLELNQIPLANMDHGEIRMELRRLYAQMQVLKTKAMRQDNPHISKKKGGRKMPHRRFSIQAFSSRTRHPKYDEETTAVKTPEESSGSVDNFHADAPTTIYEDETYNSPLHSAVASVVNSVINKKGANQHTGVTNL